MIHNTNTAVKWEKTSQKQRISKGLPKKSTTTKYS